MQRTFRVALFDLDGTLFDTEGQYSVFWGAIGREYHPEIPHFEDIIKGTTLKQIFDRYFPEASVQAEITPRLEAFESQMQYSFFSGVREFIDDLHKHGVQCAVVTSSDAKKMSNVYRAMPEFCTLFDKVLTAEMFAASKPSPDPYLKGAAAFNAEISECVVFEDAYNGLESGMSSGIFTIGVAICHTEEEIKDRCHHVIKGFDGLTYDSIASVINNDTHK